MTGAPPPVPGMTLCLADEEYRFGVGPILCRVRAVIAPVEFDGALWWHLSADCAPGTPEHHGGWTTRELYVPATAIPQPRPRRPTTNRPTTDRPPTGRPTTEGPR